MIKNDPYSFKYPLDILRTRPTSAKVTTNIAYLIYFYFFQTIKTDKKLICLRNIFPILQKAFNYVYFDLLDLCSWIILYEFY